MIRYPSHLLVNTPPPPNHRNLKQTLRSKCWDSVSDYLQDGIIPAGGVKDAISDIHTRMVRETIDAYAPNRVLGAAPPPIDASESSLPRLTRSVLCQLRSGHCFSLFSKYPQSITIHFTSRRIPNAWFVYFYTVVIELRVF